MKNNANYVEHSRTKRLSFNVETFIFISFNLFYLFLFSYIATKWFILRNSTALSILLIPKVFKFVDCALGYFYKKFSSVFASLRGNINITRVVKFFSFATVFLNFLLPWDVFLRIMSYNWVTQRLIYWIMIHTKCKVKIYK